MAARALSEDAMRRGLGDIRLPPEAAGGLFAELLAAMALGLGLALVLAVVLRLVSRPRADRPLRDPLSGRAIFATLPEPERTRAALRLLQQERPDIIAAWRDRLYRPGAAPDLAEIEAALDGGGAAR